MLKKSFKVFICLFILSSLLVSCGVKYEFNTAYHKNDDYSVVIDLPNDSKLLKSIEKDFDNDGNIEKLDVFITGKDDGDCAARPIKYVMSRKDDNKNWAEVDTVYPFDSNDIIVVPNIFSGNVGTDRLDIFIDKNNELPSIYYEETGLSGKFADGKTFCLIVFKFINNKFTKDNETVTYAGSYPDLDTLLSDYKNYIENPTNESVFDDQVSLDITKRIVDYLKYFEIENDNIGYNYPICENNKYEKLVRLVRNESNVDEADVWLNDDSNNEALGNITIKTK